jgi:hypothetical protein
VVDRLGVRQRREFVTEGSALDLKIPKSNVDNVVRRVTTKNMQEPELNLSCERKNNKFG